MNGMNKPVSSAQKTSKTRKKLKAKFILIKAFLFCKNFVCLIKLYHTQIQKKE